MWWKFMWGSKIHERLKFFLWKLANRGLSTLSNLAARGIEIEANRCIHGCDSQETEVHIFFHCEVAKRIWFTCPWSIRWENSDCYEIKGFLNCIVDPEVTIPVHQEDKNDFFLFAAIIIEHLWWIRNQVVHKESGNLLHRSMEIISSKFKEMVEAYNSEGERSNGRGNGSVIYKWNTPPHGVIKINTDAAIREDGSVLAMFARNERGEVLHIQSFNSNVSIPEVAELEAIQKAVQTATTHGFWMEESLYGNRLPNSKPCYHQKGQENAALGC